MNHDVFAGTTLNSDNVQRMILEYPSTAKFRLNEAFLAKYRGKEPLWGFGGLSKLVFQTRYCRRKDDGSVETPFEVFVRVVEGVYSIQKRHIMRYGLGWDDEKAQRSAQEMFERMWSFKFTPPGRGFWAMGSEITDRGVFAALNNCAFVSTENMGEEDPSKPFRFLMDMSMLGVGVGFDTQGAGSLQVMRPKGETGEYVIPDSREGWVQSLGLLINSYFGLCNPVRFDYSEIRPAGVPIKGFGGISSGPKPLRELHRDVREILNTYASSQKYVDSRLITDVMNLIGKCVIAGNVRRCLPEGTLVHTAQGILPIEDVEPGMLAKTSDGYVEVTEMVDQGVQEIAEVHLQTGVFKATPDHRIAVLTGVGEYEFKQVQELVPGDRMVFVRRENPGTITSLPDWSYDAPDHSTTCVDITVPDLDTDMAWFFGVLHGDGYVFPNFENNGFNAHVSIACDAGHTDQIEKVKEQLSRFGTNLNIVDATEKDASVKVRTQSKQLAWYLSQFKEAGESIVIPDFILNGTPEIRAAYLAGLMDADGCAVNRPTNLATSVYPDYLKGAQALYASLGIPTRLVEHTDSEKRKEKGWKPLYKLNLVGEAATSDFEQRVAPYSFKYENTAKTARSGNDYGFPTEWMQDTRRKRKGASRGWASNNAQKTVATYEDLDQEQVTLVPVEVLGVERTGETAHTYDISVPEAKEFVAGPGLLVHNTAEIAIGDPQDEAFLNLKNYETNPERAEYGWASNNSIYADLGMDYGPAAERTAANGEPGYTWLENMQAFGRMGDPASFADRRAAGANPCVEQTLESYELCCLVETFPANHETVEDYQRTLKFAYLYAKTVTLTQTHWAETNRVMLRNRRIGTSVTGVTQFVARNSIGELVDLLNEGYETIQHYDDVYSEWLAVPRSIKTTSVKPSGTVSLVAGATPGMHWPQANTYIRRVRLAKNSPYVERVEAAGYPVEDDQYDPSSVVVEFPVKLDEGVRTVSEVSMWEQLSMAALLQREWADNQVSATISFQEDEADQIEHALNYFQYQLKGVSFLPYSNDTYPQMPYETIDDDEYERRAAEVSEIDTDGIVLDQQVGNQDFCDSDKCEIPVSEDE